jgi:hypothetical protein
MVKSSFQSHVSINVQFIQCLFVLLKCRQLRNIKKASFKKIVFENLLISYKKAAEPKKRLNGSVTNISWPVCTNFTFEKQRNKDDDKTER